MLLPLARLINIDYNYRSNFMRQYLVILLSFFALIGTMPMANAAAALWGDVDAPVMPVEEEFKQQKELQVQQDNQKTICDLLIAQPLLSNDTANLPRIQEDIKRSLKIVSDQYKLLLATPEAVDNLYSKYRDLYLKTYCSAGVTSNVTTTDTPVNVHSETSGGVTNSSSNNSNTVTDVETNTSVSSKTKKSAGSTTNVTSGTGTSSQ